MEAKSKKRERAANFNVAETQLLVKLVEKYKHIIENKKTDAVTNKDKEAAWVKIAHSFNSCGISTTTRSWKTLKLKYEGLKKATKKKSSQQRQELYRTGGGPSNAPDFDDIEEKVLSMCSNIKGLPSRNDCDNVETPFEETNLTQEIVIVTSNDETLYPDMDEDHNIEREPHVNDITVISNNDSFYVDKQEMGQNNEKDMKQSLTLDENETNTETLKDLDQSTLQINEVADSKKERKWERWHPNALKSTMTKVLKEKVTKGSVTTKLDQLTAARLELVQLQMEIARKEHQFVEEEHKLKMEHMKNEEKRKEEIHSLQIKKNK